jgi:GST-like protein
VRRVDPTAACRLRDDRHQSGIERAMLDLYTWGTPNGTKVPILLAELGLPYEVHLVNLGQNEQKRAEYLAINPNGKIPALVDTEGTNAELVVVFESGAILEYLADKVGRFLPKDGPGRAEVLSWLYWQVGGPGPTFGQLLSFARETPRNEGAFAKLFAESKRLIGVLDSRLKDREWVAGPYSIADIANYPWFAAAARLQPTAFDGADNVKRWMATMGARPAVQTGMTFADAAKKG